MENDVEVIDVDDYKGSKDQKFSHQALVMNILNKCADAGGKEMRSGYFNTKFDKFGNESRTYIPDSRKEFIERVKTAINFMQRDFDDKMIKVVKEATEKMKKEYKRLLELEKKDWESLSSRLIQDRWRNNIHYQEETLNVNLSYFHEYLEFEVKCHREILSELLALVKRLDDYQTEDYEA